MYSHLYLKIIKFTNLFSVHSRHSNLWYKRLSKMTQFDSSSPPPNNQLLPDNLLSLHLLLVWLLTLFFCWKVFPAIFTSTVSSAPSSSSTEDKNPNYSSRVSRSTRSSREESPPTLHSLPPPTFLPVQSRHSVSSNRKLISKLQLEVCTKAKEAGNHPSYIPLVLNLIHHYNLDVNNPVLADSFTIFHCACLSGTLELVSSLSPMADMHCLTDHGDSPLYLAVYAAAHKAGRAGDHGQAGVEVVQHLLQAGSQVNQTNLAGLTALHQASRLSCPELVRILLDWGADPQGWDRSIISRRYSMAARFSTNKQIKGGGDRLNQ